MSASKFCRNFVTFPQRARENNCHSNGEKQHQTNDPKTQNTQDFYTVLPLNTEEQEQLDVPLVLVYFPESRKKHVDYRLRESTAQKKTQNIIISQHRLFDELQKRDSADRDKGLNLNMGHRRNIEEKDTNCSSDEAVKRVLRPSPRRATNDHGTSSSLCGHVESIVTSKLPPSSTLVSDRGVFHKKDKKRPFACGYCGKNYTRKKGVYRHMKQKHDEKHVTMYTLEKLFTCDQCRMRFRLESDLCRHKFLHTEERLFPCNICNKSYTFKHDLLSHCKVNKEEEYREDVICSICKKEFSHQYNLKEHMKIHIGEKPFKCSLCDKKFHVEIDLQHHMIIHNKNGKLLLGDAHGSEESKIKVPVQLNASHQNIKQFNQENSNSEQTIIQEPILASNNCSALVGQLPDNAGFVEYSIHPFQMEDSQNQAILILSTVPSGLATTDPDSALNSRLVRAIKTSSSNVCNKVVSESKVVIVGEPLTSKTLKTWSNQSQGKGYRTKAVNGKQISLASGIIYEDEVSSPEGSRCSTTAQRLLSSESSVAAEEVPAPSSILANNIHGTCSSGFRYVEPMVSLKLPPGSTLVGDRGVYRMRDKEKPFACVYCGKAYKKKKAVYNHIRYQHDEKRYSCEFCGKSYGQQYHLAQHMRIHTLEKPFTCDKCGKRFRFQSGLRQHKMTHTEVRSFVCSICNKSYTCKNYLIAHSQIHNVKECGGSICNICKKKFLLPRDLKLHMMIHTGEKPFECSLCDKQFRVQAELQKHLNIHSGLRKTCSVCGKSVGVNSMYSHMRTHTRQQRTCEKPFECNICGKRFPRKSNLEGHMRSHTGEKPFGCGGCDKRFALYSNMMTHKAKCKKTSDNVT